MSHVFPLLLLLLPSLASAQPSACPQHFARGGPPALINPKLAVQAVPLCFQAFAVLHSGATRTPLYSAERLDLDRIEAARATPRTGDFHEESRLPPGARAELSDYARSGFDRGHMAPSGDMPGPAAQQESFSLANVVPQNQRLNRGVWEGIESAVRTYAAQGRTVFVVTGPAFRATDLATVGNVLVPTHVWKAIYDPRRRAAGAYVAENVDGAGWQPMSIAALAAFTGIEAFPGIGDAVRRRAMRLPSPTPYRRRYP